MASTKELARAANATYAMSKVGRKADRIANAQAKAPEGYEIQFADRNMIHMLQGDNHIIAHRGTDVGSKGILTDLRADARIMFGTTKSSKLHKRRTRKTAAIVKSIKEQNPEASIFLTGHSLGGESAIHALHTSKIVRDGVERLETFNAGSSPLGTDLVPKKGSKKHKTMTSKSIHHLIRGDGISENGEYAGQTKIYKNKTRQTVTAKVIAAISPLAGRLTDRLAETLSAHSLKHFL